MLSWAFWFSSDNFLTTSSWVTFWIFKASSHFLRKSALSSSNDLFRESFTLSDKPSKLISTNKFCSVAIWILEILLFATPIASLFFDICDTTELYNWISSSVNPDFSFKSFISEPNLLISSWIPFSSPTSFILAFCFFISSIR